MKRDKSPVLPGSGTTDYARYMRTDVLLGLQRNPDEVIHRDELLFQVVHQSSELWFKLAAAEVTETTARVAVGDLAGAAALLARAILAVRLVTDQLEMLDHLSPADFQAMQPALGNGSGAESPGWRHVQAASRKLDRAFADHLAAHGSTAVDLRPGDRTDPTCRLAETMVEWDERVAVWRFRHYQVALRVGGHAPAGAPNSSATVLARLVEHRFFPDLWQARLHTPGGSPGTDPL